ncbi:MAG: phospholipase, partial [Verrucomicrobiota bacterium]
MNPHPANTVRLGPALEKARGVVILIHGRGSSAGDIIRLADIFGRADLAFVAPQAANHSWYPHRFLAPTAQNEPALSSALAV